MPLHGERPASSSSGDDGESPESRESLSSSGDQDSCSDSFSSDCSSKNGAPSLSASKAVSLDEIKESAKHLSDLSFVHEVIVNPNFRMEPVPLPKNNLWMMVKENLHKAFWDILETELNEDPPEYEQAIKLLEEIREILLSFLNPGANRLRTQIMEVLDMDLIRQQADNDAVDIQGLASYIIATMCKLCAPFRVEEIQKLQENTDNVVTLFKEIFKVLDLMKADMVNFDIDVLRSLLMRYGVEYEREKFQSALNKTPIVLDTTTSWIKSSFEELSVLVPSGPTANGGKEQRLVPGPFQILNSAFLRILTWDYKKSHLPETLMNDEVRLREIQNQLQLCQTVNAVLLLVYSTVGGPIQGLSSLSDRLKRTSSVLLDGMHKPDFNLEEALESTSAQICSELNKSLLERNYPTLTPELQATLTGQIGSITQKDNPIRTLVEDRLQQYFMALLSDPKTQARLEEIPPGLTAIKPELTSIGAKFISLINYNKVVYGPFYTDIIKKLLFGPPEANPGQGAARPPVPSTSN